MTVALKFDQGEFEAKVAEVQRLLAKAKATASAGFNRFIQGARDLLGDRPKLQEAIRVWGMAAGKVKDAEVKLTEVENNFIYWTGPTATAASGWVGRVQTRNVAAWKTTLGGNGGSSGAVINSLQSASDAVCQFLNGLYDALVNLVTGLLDATSGLTGIIGKFDPSKVVDAAVKATNAFITTAGKLFTTTVNAINAADKAGNDIWIAGKVLAPVADPGNGVKDLGLEPNKGVS